MNGKSFELYKDGEVLYLKSLERRYWLPFSISFLAGDIIRRKNQIGINQEIAKAVGVKKDYRPRVLDTTAGLGRDAFMLASLDCEVVMLERNTTIFALLENALELARLNPETSPIISRMKLINIDAIEYLGGAIGNFDVIYIDPMFPKSHKSRLVKKDMQIFREIAGDDLDSGKLLELALRQNVKRVVVKRMKSSPHLANMKPNFEIRGTTTRFDVYLTN